jgi:hypothetical protein
MPLTRIIRSTLIGVGCCFVIWALWLAVNTARKQAAAARIVNAGGNVKFFEDTVSTSTSLSGWLRDTVGIDTRSHVYEVSLRNAQLTDGDWQALLRLNQLTGLDLVGCEMSKEQLRSLEIMERLAFLNVSNTSISDDCAMNLLGTLPNLSQIDLRGSAVSKFGVKKMEERYPHITIKSDYSF